MGESCASLSTGFGPDFMRIKVAYNPWTLRTWRGRESLIASRLNCCHLPRVHHNTLALCQDPWYHTRGVVRVWKMTLVHPPISEVCTCVHLIKHGLDFIIVCVIPSHAVTCFKESTVVFHIVSGLCESTALKCETVKALCVLNPESDVPSLVIFPTVHKMLWFVWLFKYKRFWVRIGEVCATNIIGTRSARILFHYVTILSKWVDLCL